MYKQYQATAPQQAMPAPFQAPQFSGFKSRDEVMKEMDARRAEMQKEMEARRAQMEKEMGGMQRPMPASFDAPKFEGFKSHDEMMKEMEARRAQMDKEMQARRAQFDKGCNKL